MNRNGIAHAVAQRHNLPTAFVAVLVESVFDAIAEATAKDQEVVVSNFGTFFTQQRGERMQRNPQTGGMVLMPPRKYFRFRATGRIHEIVNGEYGDGIRKLPKGTLTRKTDR